jgi:hypothetical protein
MADIIKLKDLPKRRIAKLVKSKFLYFARDAQDASNDKFLWIWPTRGAFEMRDTSDNNNGDWDVELLPENTTVTFLFDGSLGDGI